MKSLFNWIPITPTNFCFSVLRKPYWAANSTHINNRLADIQYSSKRNKHYKKVKNKLHALPDRSDITRGFAGNSRTSMHFLSGRTPRFLYSWRANVWVWINVYAVLFIVCCLRLTAMFGPLTKVVSVCFSFSHFFCHFAWGLESINANIMWLQSFNLFMFSTHFVNNTKFKFSHINP